MNLIKTFIKRYNKSTPFIKLRVIVRLILILTLIIFFLFHPKYFWFWLVVATGENIMNIEP